MSGPTKAKRASLAKRGKAEGKSKPGAKRGSYPTDTPGRARAAKAYSTTAVRKGRMSAATKRGIDARADRELKK